MHADYSTFYKPHCLLESPELDCSSLLKIKRRGILYSCLSHDQALALPPQRISNALAHVVLFINDHSLWNCARCFASLSMTILVLHDKARPRGHRQGVINARSGRSVAVSSLCSNLRDSIVEDNVRKRPFQHVLTHLPTEWANESLQR